MVLERFQPSPPVTFEVPRSRTKSPGHANHTGCYSEGIGLKFEYKVDKVIRMGLT